MMVSIQCGPKETLAVVDTAAQATLVNRDFYLQLEVESSLENKKVVLLKGLGEIAVEAVKVPQFQFQLGDTTFTWDVFVTPMADDLILGLDFLEHHGSQVDLEKHTVRIGDQLLSAQMRKELTEEIHVNRVFIAKRIVIPPNSVKHALVKIDSVTNRFTNFCISPCGSNKDILVAHTLATGPVSPIRLLNENVMSY
jgi:hypothetical protein